MKTNPLFTKDEEECRALLTKENFGLYKRYENYQIAKRHSASQQRLFSISLLLSWQFLFSHVTA
jgi:hypothetical protein